MRQVRRMIFLRVTNLYLECMQAEVASPFFQQKFLEGMLNSQLDVARYEFQTQIFMNFNLKN